MSKVYISLTTISSRVILLRKCLDSLLDQDYPVEKILLTIPQRSLRGNRIEEVPSYLLKSPYKDKVKIIRPRKDYGPITKYIGGYKYIPKQSLVFVCDDDQRYSSDLVSKLVNKYKSLPHNHQDKSVVTASGTTIICTDVVYGHGSLLIPSHIIRLIRDSVISSTQYVRDCCQMVDDNWVSIILKKNGISVINMNMDSERYITGEPIAPEDGLAFTTNRCMDIAKCTYAIDHENTYPIVALILFVIFIITITINYYYVSYY
jgi:hypothetical protein